MSEGITPDFLILADAAQVQGDKLYLLGGGWTMVGAKEFPAQHQMAVAAGILVPWLETNARHNFRIVVRAEDGTVFTDVGGEFEQGRPPGLPPGTTQRVMFTVNMGIRIERAVEAVAELWTDGALARSVPFRIVESAPR
ncbi:MAG TPA: hypothetical protein VEZ14_05390 [Dehalococcoidia bacterium]|nr:hypothetical protein [Dehalococcoidia bacterium]